MNKVNYLVEDSVILTGIGISLVDIQNILSIILLIFNVVWIIVKMIVKGIKYVKSNKDLDELDTYLDDLKDVIKKDGE